MTDSTHINPDSILVAIDIAKQNHDALILWPSGHKKRSGSTNLDSGRPKLRSYFLYDNFYH